MTSGFRRRDFLSLALAAPLFDTVSRGAELSSQDQEGGFTDDFNYETVGELEATGWTIENGGFTVDNSELKPAGDSERLNTITHPQSRSTGTYEISGVKNNSRFYGLRAAFISKQKPPQDAEPRLAGIGGYSVQYQQSRFGEVRLNRLGFQDIDPKTLLILDEDHGGNPEDVRIERDADTYEFTVYYGGEKVGTVQDDTFTESSFWTMRCGGLGPEDQEIDAVNASNQPEFSQARSPTASFEFSPAAPTTEDTITLDASESSDPDGAIESYEWDIGNDGEVNLTGQTVETEIKQRGSVSVKLRITDTDGNSDVTIKTIRVSVSIRELERAIDRYQRAINDFVDGFVEARARAAARFYKQHGSDYVDSRLAYWARVGNVGGAGEVSGTGDRFDRVFDDGVQEDDAKRFYLALNEMWQQVSQDMSVDEITAVLAANLKGTADGQQFRPRVSGAESHGGSGRWIGALQADFNEQLEQSKTELLDRVRDSNRLSGAQLAVLIDSIDSQTRFLTQRKNTAVTNIDEFSKKITERSANVLFTVGAYRTPESDILTPVTQAIVFSLPELEVEGNPAAVTAGETTVFSSYKLDTDGSPAVPVVAAGGVAISFGAILLFAALVFVGFIVATATPIRRRRGPEIPIDWFIQSMDRVFGWAEEHKWKFPFFLLVGPIPIGPDLIGLIEELSDEALERYGESLPTPLTVEILELDDLTQAQAAERSRFDKPVAVGTGRVRLTNSAEKGPQNPTTFEISPCVDEAKLQSVQSSLPQLSPAQGSVTFDVDEGGQTSVKNFECSTAFEFSIFEKSTPSPIRIERGDSEIVSFSYRVPLDSRKTYSLTLKFAESGGPLASPIESDTETFELQPNAQTKDDTSDGQSSSIVAEGVIRQGETSQTSRSLAQSVRRVVWAMSYPGSDLDLHLYDADGNHVGINYETGEFETEIPNVSASGPDGGAGNEWIGLTDAGEEYDIQVVGVETDDGGETYTVTETTIPELPATLTVSPDDVLVDVFPDEQAVSRLLVAETGGFTELQDVSVETTVLTGVDGTRQFPTDAVTIETTNGFSVDPGNRRAVTIVIDMPADGPVGRFSGELTVTATSADGDRSKTVPLTVDVRRDLPPVVGDRPPRDLDGDGLYEDINGDGQLDVGDAQALFENLDSEAVQNNPDAFDFNDDGKVDVIDVSELFDESTE